MHTLVHQLQQPYVWQYAWQALWPIIGIALTAFVCVTVAMTLGYIVTESWDRHK